MNSARRRFPQLIAGTLLVALAVCRAAAQAGSNSPPLSLPPLPITRSPVDSFRELLALEPAAQRAALTNRTAEARQRLIAKIRDYNAMHADERELRLLATELRWYLLPLMQLPPTHRTGQLAAIRDPLRPLVESRLARWDALPVELREQFLQNEQALSLLLQLGPASARAREAMVAEVAPELRAALNLALARLDAMNPTERQRAFEVFENAFSMTAAERQKVLRTMSDAEKKQMEKTLDLFGKLTVEQRRQCVRAYEKFAGMTPIERALFTRNVQLWEKMSPKERQQWRELVKNVDLLPPMPEVKPTLPPLPPDPLPRVMTNRT